MYCATGNAKGAGLEEAGRHRMTYLIRRKGSDFVQCHDTALTALRLVLAESVTTVFFLMLAVVLSIRAYPARAGHIAIPQYWELETTGTRTITTNPLTGMLLYRIEFKDRDGVAVAYRICKDQQERFPFAIADFIHDTLFLDTDRDGHIDEVIAPADLPTRNLADDVPSCSRSSETPSR
jgi:hypothetical protein